MKQLGWSDWSAEFYPDLPSRNGGSLFAVSRNHPPPGLSVLLRQCFRTPEPLSVDVPPDMSVKLHTPPLHWRPNFYLKIRVVCYKHDKIQRCSQFK
jgi:hypothetical protein